MVPVPEKRHIELQGRGYCAAVCPDPGQGDLYPIATRKTTSRAESGAAVIGLWAFHSVVFRSTLLIASPGHSRSRLNLHCYSRFRLDDLNLRVAGVDLCGEPG